MSELNDDVASEFVAPPEHDHLSTLIDTVAALVVVVDLEGRVRRFNRACEILTGFSRHDVVGRSFRTALVPADRDEVARQRWATLRTTREPISFDNEWRCADGSRRTIAWTCTPLLGPTGDIKAVVGTGIEVTDQRLLDERFAQLERLDSIGRLAAGIAHDFNNTLAALRLRIARLRARGRSIEESAPELDAMERTIDHSQSLIAELSTFSRRDHLAALPVDVNAAVQRVAADGRGLFGAAIEIHLDLTDDELVTMIDPARFDRILMNLMLNARDAMPGGGTLTMITDRRPVPGGPPLSVPPGGLAPGEYVRVSVADTGVGIEQRHLARVFDPYFTTKPPGVGTGLGLATAFGTVTQLGGAIDVSSTVGLGSTVTVWLPITPVTPPSPPPALPLPFRGLATDHDEGVEVAVLDTDGVIASVNPAWERFSRDNGGHPAGTGVGVSYLAQCELAGDDPTAAAVAGAIRSALRGELISASAITIGCDAPDEPRRFEVFVSSRFGLDGSCSGATVMLVPHR